MCIHQGGRGIECTTVHFANLWQKLPASENTYTVWCSAQDGLTGVVPCHGQCDVGLNYIDQA